MKKAISRICAVSLALVTFGATLIPAQAASLQTLQFTPGNAEFVTVQNRGYNNRNRNAHRGFERRGNNGYYNGHRGSQKRVPGYRQHNGFWFPPAAFAFGAIMGGLIIGSQQQQAPRGSVLLGPVSQQHLRWCESRYRSYRASDNTFQPYNGPRQQCISPYLR